MKAYLGLVILALSTQSNPATAQRFEPWPKCWTCVSRSNILSPVVGIEIGPSYLTAAIRFHNGSIHNLAKFDGSAAYRDLMRRLASGDSTAEGSHHADWLPLVQQAGSSKKHLLPLSHPDPRPADSLKILGSALLGLRTAVASVLPNNEPFPSSLASFTSFPGLPYDLIADAFKYANIHLLGDSRVSPVGAAAAANDLGLCSNFVEPDKCEGEEWTMPKKRVLAVEYTKMALTVTVSPFRASRNGYDRILLREWDLGSDSEPPMEDEDSHAENYWRRVRHLIQRLPAKQSVKSPITEVIVMGESVLEESFIDVMRDALKSIIDEGVPMYLFDVDPTFAAARGAAEFGKRAMECPNDCVETAVCKYWRRYIGEIDVLGPSCHMMG